MKAIKSLALAAALTAVGFTATLDVQAAGGHGGGGGTRGVSTGGHGGGHWSGGGHNGGGGHYHGGAHYHGGGYYPYWGFYWGAPLLWSSYYWGSPYAWGYPNDYYYPSAAVAYSQPYPQQPYPQQGYPQQGYPEGTMEPAPTTQVNPGAAGAPSQGPAYLNFCASANAYYPKVTSCPEGWKFQPAR